MGLFKKFGAWLEHAANLAQVLTFCGVASLVVLSATALVFWKKVFAFCWQHQTGVWIATAFVMGGLLVFGLMKLLQWRKIGNPNTLKDRLSTAVMAVQPLIQRIDHTAERRWDDPDYILDRLNDCYAAERKLVKVGVRMFMRPAPKSDAQMVRNYRNKFHQIRHLLTPDLIEDVKYISKTWEREAMESIKDYPDGHTQFVRNYR